MVTAARRAGLALAAFLIGSCTQIDAQTLVKAPLFADQPAASLDASITERGASSVERPVIVHYDSAIVDTHAKTARKARELEDLPGVRNASALLCGVGVVMVSFHSEETQRQLITELADNPQVEFARFHDEEVDHCSAPDIQVAKDLLLMLEQPMLVNATEDKADFQGFVQGSLTVHGLDIDVARDLQQQAWRRLVARSLQNATEGNVEIESVAPFPARKAGQQRKNPQSLRAKTTKVAFRVVALPGAATAFLDEVEAQLKRLHSGGRATERFDAALDTELAVLEVQLPDWAKSRFALPQRARGIDSEGNPIFSHNHGDDGDVLMIVCFMLLLLVLGPAMGLGSMMCFFQSSTW